MDLENQEYLLLELQALILAVAIAIPLAIGAGVKSPMLIAVYVIIAYYFISLLLNNISNSDKKKKEAFALVSVPANVKMDYQNNGPTMRNNGPGGIKDYGVMPKHETIGMHKDCATESTSNLQFPNSGPLDNLNCHQLKNNLQTLYQATKHPYRDEVNLEKESDDDKILKEDKNIVNTLNLNEKDEKYLKISEKAYPQLTKNQINASDCTSYQSGPMSCNQQPNSANLFPPKKSLLVSGCKSEKDLKKIAREDFSVPASIQNTVVKPLFKNAPEGSLNSKDISDNLCGNCVVGECKYDICF